MTGPRSEPAACAAPRRRWLGLPPPSSTGWRRSPRSSGHGTCAVPAPPTVDAARQRRSPPPRGAGRWRRPRRAPGPRPGLSRSLSASGRSLPHGCRSRKKVLVAIGRPGAGVCCPVEPVEGAGGLEQRLLVEHVGVGAVAGQVGGEAVDLRLVLGQHVVESHLVLTWTPVDRVHRNWRHPHRRHAAVARCRPCASRRPGHRFSPVPTRRPILGSHTRRLLRFISGHGSTKPARQTMPLRPSSLPAVGSGDVRQVGDPGG